MNQRELLLSVISGEPAYRFPVIGPGGLINIINRTILDRLGIPLPAAHYSGAMMAELAAAGHDMEGFDNVGVPLCLTVEAEVLGAKVDMGDTMVLPRIVSYPELNIEDIIANALPALLNHGRVPQVLRAVELLRGMRPGVPILGNIAGPATLAASLVRPTAMIELVQKGPDVLNRLFEGIISFLCAYVEALVDNGADIIMVHEPVARSSPYMGFDLFINVLPYMNELSKYAQLGGAKLILHICGGRFEHVRAVREAQMDAYSFEADVDPGEAREVLKKPIIGTVPASMVNYFPPEMVLEETLMAIQRGASMMCPPCGLGLDTPFQNLRIMKEASRRFRP
ncbi:MAG: uroporphyrinogen decarboxylase family protein [Actinomycetota bacterium]|nr:uroporphyrinogen decarboxylase family protein [Actinomycetota bacterium]